MKRTGLIGVVLLLCLSLSTTGCLCGRYARPCGPVLGCGFPGSVGVVDYVDGQPGACEADCGGCGTAPVAGYGYPCYGYPGGGLATIGNGIVNVGEGVVCLAASPFILVGKIITGGACGYERFPGCGCSGEVYYGDNCYQAHDLRNPCAGAGCGSATGTTGCSRCSGGFSEGIQPSDESALRPQPTRVTQTSFRSMQPQRLTAPPRPSVIR